MGKLFNELMEGMQALELHLQGKITLKTLSWKFLIR